MGGMQELSHIKQQIKDAPGCRDCIRRASCPGYELSREESRYQGSRIQHPMPIHQGQFVCNIGDECDSVYIVRSGSFKSYYLDEFGEIQVLGFHVPGEIFGVEGLLTGKHGHFVQALCTASVCRVPLAMFGFSEAQTGRPDTSLLHLIGQVLSRDHKVIFMLSRMTAQRKFAYFLVDLVDRLRLFGVEQGEFTLSMSRADIANYLGLAIETISRLFTQLQSQGLLDVRRRRLKIRDMRTLRALANEQPLDPPLLDPPLLDKAG
ncbi:MAG: helix-turn-helix domain-containing protein [Pseudohongiellaceae bacterium]